MLNRFIRRTTPSKRLPENFRASALRQEKRHLRAAITRPRRTALFSHTAAVRLISINPKARGKAWPCADLGPQFIGNGDDTAAWS